MRLCSEYRARWLCLALILIVSAGAGFGQQVVERGAFGKPAQVLDETNQWTTPLLVAADEDVHIYIPDVSSPDWLKRNYPDFHDRGIYTLSMFTFYRTPKACRENQTGWGLGDKAHLDACISIGYRVRRAVINPEEKSATLIMAAMIDQSGKIEPDSIQTEQTFRFWNQLDANTRSALEKANALITKQLTAYDEKMQSLQ